MNLRQGLGVVLYVLEHLIREHEVEGTVREGKSIRCSLDKTNQTVGTKSFHIGTVFEREVTAERLVAEPSVVFDDGSVSATQIQHSRTRFQREA